MRSSELDLAKYDTDKITNEYLAAYDAVLSPLADREVCLLELGIRRGGSLLLWRDYFPRGRIAGIDIRAIPGWRPQERIEVFQGRQEDTELLSQVAATVAPEGFDVIIDDASHVAEPSRISFWHLFERHLKPGGIYVIEDWGTGYWDDWPDGRRYEPPAAEVAGEPPAPRVTTAGEPPAPRCEPPRDRPPPERGSFWQDAGRSLRSLGGSAKREMFRLAKAVLPRTDFPSHSFGMVGFIKELIDEQGAADHTRGSTYGTPGRPSKFQRILVMPSLVFVTKRR